MVRQKRGASPATAGRGAERARTTSSLVIWYEDNKRWMPLILTVFGGASLYLLMQVQALRNPVAFLGGLGWIVGYAIWGLGRPPDAPARPGRSPAWWPLVLALTLTASGLAFVYVTTVYRGQPVYSTTLAREGSKARFELRNPKQRLTVVVHGSFARDVGTSAEGDYEVLLSRGDREMTISGKLQRSTSRTRIRRGVRGASTTEYDYGSHEVASLGRGTYVLEHLGTAETLRPHLRVSIYTSWASALFVIGGVVGFFLLGLVFDVVGARAGHRTRGASAIATVGSFTETFRRMATPDAVVSAVVVGIIASFVVGGGLGWIADQIAKRSAGEAPRKRARDEEEGEDEENDAQNDEKDEEEGAEK